MAEFISHDIVKGTEKPVGDRIRMPIGDPKKYDWIEVVAHETHIEIRSSTGVLLVKPDCANVISVTCAKWEDLPGLGGL